MHAASVKIKTNLYHIFASVVMCACPGINFLLKGDNFHAKIYANENILLDGSSQTLTYAMYT